MAPRRRRTACRPAQRIADFRRQPRHYSHRCQAFFPSNVLSVALAASGSLPARDASSSALPGWHSIHQSFVADGAPSPIVVSRPAAIASWAVAGLLASFLLGRWFYRGRCTLLLGLIFAAACLALLLPAEFAPLATGALWGLALSSAWRVVSLAAGDCRRGPARSLFSPAVAGCLTAILQSASPISRSPKRRKPTTRNGRPATGRRHRTAC